MYEMMDKEMVNRIINKIIRKQIIWTSKRRVEIVDMQRCWSEGMVMRCERTNDYRKAYGITVLVVGEGKRFKVGFYRNGAVVFPFVHRRDVEEVLEEIKNGGV